MKLMMFKKGSGEALGVVLDLTGHLLGRVADGLGADLLHALAELRRLDDLHSTGHRRHLG